jgi:acyl-coenzyme A thioesterase 9
MLSPLIPANVHDLRLSGQVIYVGSSSMEIAVKIENVGKTSAEDETVLIGKAIKI